MKAMTQTIAMAATLVFTQISFADYSVGQLVDSYKVAKSANSYVIEPAEIKDRPFTIQVASHINEKEAIEHVEQLRLQEESVFYYPNFVKSQVFFKVCVGRFDTKEAADTYRTDFVRRMDEPFAVTITMLDRPGADKKATKAQVASAKKSAPVAERAIASVDAAAPTIDLKSEAAAAKKDYEAAHGKVKAVAPKMNVQLMHKSQAQEAVKEALHAPAAAPAAVPPAEKVVAHASPVAAAANHGVVQGSKIYSLQVAAYPSEEMAKAESAKVSAKGQEIYYKTADVNGKTWYRVLVGKFKTFNEAQAFQGVYQEQKPGQTIVRKFVD